MSVVAWISLVLRKSVPPLEVRSFLLLPPLRPSRFLCSTDANQCSQRPVRRRLWRHLDRLDFQSPLMLQGSSADWNIHCGTRAAISIPV